MNPPNKKSPEAKGLPQQFKQAGHTQSFKPAVAQSKNAVSAQNVKRPVAPPVYNPQSKPVAAQAKMAGPSQMKTSPAAPPVYRPQSIPKVLQAKTAQREPSPAHSQVEAKRATAPPAYRPQPTPGVLQRTASHVRPPQMRRGGTEVKAVGGVDTKRSAVVSAYQPHATTVLQLSEMSKKELKDYKKKYKNKRALASAIENAKTYTMPVLNKGGKKKAQQEKHQQEYDKDVKKFSGNLLDKSEGSIYTGGHAKQKHGEGMTIEDLVARKLPVASKFTTDEDQQVAVAELIKEKRDELVQWLKSDKDRLVLSIERPDSVNAEGVEKSKLIGPRYVPVKNEALQYIVAVFQKDKVSNGNPWGLVTCYPSKQPTE